MTIEELPTPGVHGGGCGCGGHDGGEPTIDATAIPHRLRHAAVLGAAGSMNAGEAFIIRAPHLPRPLLAQIMQLPGEWTFEVLVDGPEYWDNADAYTCGRHERSWRPHPCTSVVEASAQYSSSSSSSSSSTLAPSSGFAPAGSDRAGAS